MATATQPAQTLETQTALDKVARITIAAWMREAAQQRGLTVTRWLEELAIAERAELRSQKFSALPRESSAFRAPKQITGTNGHRLPAPTAEEVQKIIFLRESQSLTVTDIAVRMHRSPTSIARILSRREALVPSAPRATHGRVWGSLGRRNGVKP